MKNFLKSVVAFGLGILGLGSAFAQTAPDYSSIVEAVDAGTIVTGIVAMGAVMILPGVAKWATKKLATFFG